MEGLRDGGMEGWRDGGMVTTRCTARALASYRM